MTLKGLNSKKHYFYKPEFQSLAYDVYATKLYILIYWVNVNIKQAPGNFISTNELYDLYKKDVQTINSVAVMNDSTFYKDIQQALLANNFIVAKARQQGSRGFNGIQYSSIFKNVEEM